MARIAVVSVPFIKYEFHFLFMANTIVSLLKMKHEHELDLIAVVNAFDTGPSDLNWVKQTFDLVEINDRNNLARAWNKGIRHAFERGADYALIINLDLLFNTKFLANLVNFAAEKPDAIAWSGQEWSTQENLETAPLVGELLHSMHASCFLIDKRLFELVGQFDEQFEPAYHEDSDMLYRIKLLGLSVLSTAAARFYHLERVTLKGAVRNSDEQVLTTIRAQMDESMLRYEKKWGGLPGQEIFKSPYNKNIPDDQKS